MKFLIDECAGPAVAKWLRSQGHDAFSVYDQARGISDDAVIAKAYSEDRILITADKDFGEKVYRENKLHKGIILFRLADQTASAKCQALERLLNQYSARLGNSFVVVTERQVRFASL